jgi:hypothetical protein
MLRKASATTKRYLFNGHELSDPYNCLNDEIITKLMEFISFYWAHVAAHRYLWQSSNQVCQR